ncbi:hypothetical protein ODJ79_08825 [Actinoplanes sp. KI2]|uniref:hypothetical protein n=1 Tax=Actinoplanes sp. KI2 TaxID=2983315 RepID=UPI0021D5F773|nr:hypothetical protein [Actinoplanes sp. KI2]MCU7723814.1 hypothetical protein [Actinoplanes sp. KI2]
MISETLMAVVAAGGSALVGAAATDAWQSARGGLVRLFAKAGRREETAARWTDEMAAELEASPPAERAVAEQRWVQTWQQRLHDLVEEDPQIGDELREWAEAVRAQLPAERQSWVNTFIAADHARQYNAPGGSITVHHHPD